MTAPATMPTFAPDPRLGSFLPVGWLVTVTVVAAAVVEENFKGKDVEVGVKEVEVEASDAEVDSSEVLELEALFNWSSGGAWKVSESGSEQFLPLGWRGTTSP